MRSGPRRWLRILGGSALIAGGLLGFLPILGFWMIPLGIGILGQEVTWVRRLEHRLMDKLRGLVGRFGRHDG